MIDIGVAWDKLSNFETAQEIREYFSDEGITGERGEAANCPISNWLRTTTEAPLVTVSENVKVWTEDPAVFNISLNRVKKIPIIKLEHTYATKMFMDEFDRKQYPELIYSESDRESKVIDPCLCEICI